MQISFDIAGLRYVSIATLLIAAVFVLGIYVSHEAASIVFEQDTLRYIPIVNIRSAKPIYKQISKDAVVYRSREEMLQERSALIKAGKDFLFADLASMELTLYKNGVLEQSFPILTKGKEDTFFETPSGSYTIRSREENHFSSIGKVWMPWSMQFYGNYFIHGWPYYPNGTPVASAYSGGCIRLSTKDAKALWNSAKKDMAVLVYAENPYPFSEFSYFRKIAEKSKAEVMPAFSAVSAAAIDFETGQIIYAKNIDLKHPIASITKLMTALTAVETINRFKPIAMTKSAQNTEGNSSNTKAGETVTTEEWLYPLLLASANDVAALLANETYNFTVSMNQKARAIGMSNTAFKDASGLDRENVSTAEDLYKLLSFIAENKPPIFAIMGLSSHSLTTSFAKREWHNTSVIPDIKGFIAGKSGKTAEAGEAYAGVFSVKLAEFEERKIAIIVLQSEDRRKDIALLKEYLENNFIYGTAALVRNRKGRPHVIEQEAAIFEALKDMWIIKSEN